MEQTVTYQAESDETGSFTFSALEDGLDVSAGPRFYAPEAFVAAALATMLRGVLDLHDDPRGVFIYPDFAEPSSQTYEDRVRELASVGRFLPRSQLQVPADAAAWRRLEAEIPEANAKVKDSRVFAMQIANAFGVDPDEVQLVAKSLRRR